MMWMYSGYESMSTLAAEVENPQRLIPRAIMIARADRDRHLRAHHHGRHHGGRQGQLGQHGVRRCDRRRRLVDFVRAGQIVGGAVLLWALLASAIASNLGLYTGYLASGSRPSYPDSRATAFYPRFMGTAHKRWGTPWVAILIMGAGRRHPHQVRLHDAHRDRRVPAHVQLHPDLHRGHRAARARTRHAAPVPRAACPPGCWRLRVLSRSRSPSTRSSPTVPTTWSAA